MSKDQPKMKFTIDRKTWLRGEGSDDSFLLRTDGKKCCLGFYMNACGISDDEIREMESPSALFSYLAGPGPGSIKPEANLIPAWTIRAHKLMEVNDQEREISEEKREAYVYNAFARQGVEVTFID